VPAPNTETDRLAVFARRVALGASPSSRPGWRIGRVAAVVLVLLLFPVAVVFAGAPARGYVAPNSDELLTRVPVHVNDQTLPQITVSQDVLNFDPDLAGSGIDPVLVTLGQNLEVENQALLRRDVSLLEAVDHGDRLDQMKAELTDDAASGTTIVRHYDFDTVNVNLLVPFGQQTGASLGFQSQGTVTEQTYDANGALTGTAEKPFTQTFAVRRATGGRWLNVAELP